MAGTRHIVAAVAVGALASGGTAGAETPAPGAEHYVYTATPGDEDTGDVETHRIDITTDSSGVVYAFETDLGDGRERGWIRTQPDGTFLGAVRIVADGDDAVVETDTLRVEGPDLVMIRVRGTEAETKRASLPAEPLAVDASLLVRLRSFPLGEHASRQMFMADWSQRTVHVDVHDRGLETIIVPAGTFSCYRIEVVIKVFIFRPKITFWISEAPPHFLVQHRGKRGPFTPVFHTELVEKGQP